MHTKLTTALDILGSLIRDANSKNHEVMPEKLVAVADIVKIVVDQLASSNIEDASVKGAEARPVDNT